MATTTQNVPATIAEALGSCAEGQDQPINRPLSIKHCALPETANPDVHTTVRQRIRAARKAELRGKWNESEVTRKTATTSKKEQTNHVGQALDNREPAISRLIRGDFYNHKGTPAGDVLAAPQGTKPRQNNALAIPPVTTTGTNTEQDTTCNQLHTGQRRKHHCHHAHRPRDKAVETEPPKPKVRASSSYARPTTSSQTKNHYKTMDRMLSEQKRQEAALEAQGPVNISRLHQHKNYGYADPYEEALEKVNREHNPGEAAVILNSDLQSIKKRLLSNRRPRTASAAAAKKYEGPKQIFF